MTLLDDNTAHNLDSATSTTVAEPSASAPEESTPDHTSQPQAVAPRQEEKPATSSEDFASALESFTTETEEAAGENHVLKGTVLKLTPTHVVVDIGAKSEGMLPNGINGNGNCLG